MTVELRPPRAELESATGIDAWIDTYHAVSSLARQNVRVMITDSAVGAQEENNLRHLVANLGLRNGAAPTSSRFSRASIRWSSVWATPTRPLITAFRRVVVLGGDKHVGRPRCVEHAWQLREHIRTRHPELELGGWANPNAAARPAGGLPARSPGQRRFLSDADRVAPSGARQVDAFLDEARAAI